MQTTLPIDVSRVGDGGLLEPLRVAVDRAQKEARAALDDMDSDSKGTMAWDSCEDAIQHMDLSWLYNCRADAKDNAWNAERRLDGYDTWESAALARHVKELRRLLDALTRLIGALNHLARREAAEITAAGPWGDVSPEEAARMEHQMKNGPCFECGAASAKDADGKCLCGGDKDHCHGCDIWPDA